MAQLKNYSPLYYVVRLWRYSAFLWSYRVWWNQMLQVHLQPPVPKERKVDRSQEYSCYLKEMTTELNFTNVKCNNFHILTFFSYEHFLFRFVYFQMKKLNWSGSIQCTYCVGCRWSGIHTVYGCKHFSQHICTGTTNFLVHLEIKQGVYKYFSKYTANWKSKQIYAGEEFW